jgi:hypothetical protein
MSENHLYLTPEQFVALDKAIQEAVDSNIRIEGEKSFQKDVSARVKDELGIKPAEFNKLVSEYFDNKVSDSIQKLESILEIKEQIDTAIKNTKA